MQLKSIEEQILDTTRTRAAQQTDSYAAHRRLVFRGERISSFRHTAKMSQASVMKLISVCDTFHSEATARTSEVAAIRARPSSTVSGAS